MLAVRYVALAALVFWLGAIAATLTGQSTDDASRWHFLPEAAACIIIGCFVVMKLVGPPPAAFFLRTAIVIAMLAVAIYADWARPRPSLPMSIDLALGGVLLFWYVKE